MTLAALRRALAEFIGTLAIVFFGCGAITVYGPGSGAAGALGIPLAFGAVVAVMIAALGPVCRAHFNPAVTLGFCIAEEFPRRRAALYVLAQALGGIAGAALVSLCFPAAGAVRLGATLPHVSSSAAAVGIEAVLTFFLMLVIAQVASLPQVSSPLAGAAIGATVALCAFVGGPLTGASMNPARSFGPALLSGWPALHVLWIYVAGPCLGASCAALTHRFLRASVL